MFICPTCKGTGLIFEIVESDGKNLVEECPACNCE